MCNQVCTIRTALKYKKIRIIHKFSRMRHHVAMIETKSLPLQNLEQEQSKLAIRLLHKEIDVHQKEEQLEYLLWCRMSDLKIYEERPKGASHFWSEGVHVQAPKYKLVANANYNNFVCIHLNMCIRRFHRKKTHDNNTMRFFDVDKMC